MSSSSIAALTDVMFEIIHACVTVVGCCPITSLLKCFLAHFHDKYCWISDDIVIDKDICSLTINSWGWLIASRFEILEENIRMMFDDIWEIWISFECAATGYSTEQSHAHSLYYHPKLKCLAQTRMISAFFTLAALHTIFSRLFSTRQCLLEFSMAQTNCVKAQHSSNSQELLLKTQVELVLKKATVATLDDLVQMNKFFLLCYVSLFICGLLQVIILRRGLSKPPNYALLRYIDQITGLRLTVFACRSVIVHEDVMLTIGALAYVIVSKFAKIMPYFYQYLEMGLQNFVYQIYDLTIGVVRDIVKAFTAQNLFRYGGTMQQMLGASPTSWFYHSTKSSIFSYVHDPTLTNFTSAQNLVWIAAWLDDYIMTKLENLITDEKKAIQPSMMPEMEKLQLEPSQVWLTLNPHNINIYYPPNYLNGGQFALIHDDTMQLERERALRLFKRGKTPTMVATHVGRPGMVDKQLKESTPVAFNWLNNYVEQSWYHGKDNNQRYGVSSFGDLAKISPKHFSPPSPNAAPLLVILSTLIHLQAIEFITASNLLHGNSVTSYNWQSTSSSPDSVPLLQLTTDDDIGFGVTLPNFTTFKMIYLASWYPLFTGDISHASQEAYDVIAAYHVKLELHLFDDSHLGVPIKGDWLAPKLPWELRLSDWPDIYAEAAYLGSMAWQEALIILGSTDVCSFHFPTTFLRPEDTPVFKGGGMLGPLCYIYILCWGRVSIYLMGWLLDSGRVIL